jgi:hypothetical protein
VKSTDPAPKLDKLLDRVAIAPDKLDAARWAEPVLDADQPLLNELLRAFLVWEAGVPRARAAAARLASHLVDFNDLRVCLPEDLESILAPDPHAQERAQRLRAAFTDLVRRTHAASLEHLTRLGKREASAYLASLEGVPQFVAARVGLLALGAHAMPMDRRTHARLVHAGAVPEGSMPEDAGDMIERRVKAGELLPVYVGLQVWADEQADDEPPARKKKSKAAGEDTARR